MDKTCWAMQVIVFLALLLDTVRQTLSIPVEKRDKAVRLLNDIVDKKKATILELQQLTGLLNFISRAVVLGRALTRRMYCKFAKYLKPVLENRNHQSTSIVNKG